MTRTNSHYKLEDRDLILVTGGLVLSSSLCPQIRGHTYFYALRNFGSYAALKLMQAKANA
jgi:hypothetical protein